MDARHHRATRDVQREIVFVAVPTPQAGSPKEAGRARPPAYPANQREAWRPQTRPPSKGSKGAATLELMRRIQRQDQEVRAFMKESRYANS